MRIGQLVLSVAFVGLGIWALAEGDHLKGAFYLAISVRAYPRASRCPRRWPDRVIGRPLGGTRPRYFNRRRNSSRPIPASERIPLNVPRLTSLV